MEIEMARMIMDTPDEMANKILKIAQANRMTKVELAREIGISSFTLARVLNGVKVDFKRQLMIKEFIENYVLDWDDSINIYGPKS
jgi:DNA transposition AAA+ family ATPase